MVSLTKEQDTECMDIFSTCESKGGTICCMYYGVLTEPKGTTGEIALGNLILDGLTASGLPDTVGEATMFCTDYKKVIAEFLTVPGTNYDNGVMSYSAANGSLSYNFYCSGATTLAAATAAVAVATISLY